MNITRKKVLMFPEDAKSRLELGREYFGNRIYARLISLLTKGSIKDASCGFRAYSRKSLMNLSLVFRFTYTHATLLELLYKNFKHCEIPISVKYFKTRQSHLTGNLFNQPSLYNEYAQIIDFVAIRSSQMATFVNATTVKLTNVKKPLLPSELVGVFDTDNWFRIYINGDFVSPTYYTYSYNGSVNEIVFVFSLTYPLDANDEIAITGKPCVFVPYPFAAEDHQTFNAKTLVDDGAAFMVKDAMVKDAEANAADDQKFADLVQARNTADGLAHAAKKTLEDAGDKASEEEKTAIEAAIKGVEEAVQGEDSDAIEAATKVLSEASAALAQKLYAEQAEAGQAEGGEQAAGDDAMDAEFEEVKEETAEETAEEKEDKK